MVFETNTQKYNSAWWYNISFYVSNDFQAVELITEFKYDIILCWVLRLHVIHIDKKNAEFVFFVWSLSGIKCIYKQSNTDLIPKKLQKSTMSYIIIS